MELRFKLEDGSARMALQGVLRPGKYKCQIREVEVIKEGPARGVVLVDAQFIREYPRPLDHEE